jgi:hypothetical protein
VGREEQFIGAIVPGGQVAVSALALLIKYGDTVDKTLKSASKQRVQNFVLSRILFIT